MNTDKKQKRAKGTKRAAAKELIEQWGRLRFLAVASASDCQLTGMRLLVMRQRLELAGKTPLVEQLLQDMEIVISEHAPVAKNLMELDARIAALKSKLSNP